MRTLKLEVSDSEARILQQLLTILREPDPRNGAPSVIVLTKSKYQCNLVKAAPRGAIDLRRR